jgi:cation diffusion facilitator CzcD-associated flavoprotein CzcO
MTSSDAIIIGAGLSGMYALHRLRGLGFRVRVFEAGGDVGGTWYWNRYPGARFDSESWTYGFSFSEELLREWDWSEHFSGQPENLRYCNLVADKFDLRRDITFNERIAAARWDEGTGEWEVESTGGAKARARFLVTALGPLSRRSCPTFPVSGSSLARRFTPASGPTARCRSRASTSA